MLFHQQIISYFLNKHHLVQIKSYDIVSTLLIIYYLQLISLTLDFDESIANVQTQINLLFFFDYLRNICKPYIFVLQYQKFRQYCFILPALLLLFQLIGLIIDQLVQKVIQKLIKISKQEIKEYKVFETEKLLSLLFQTHQHIISLYSFDLFFISLVEAQNTNEIVIMIFCITLLLGELVFVFLNIVCSQSIHFNSSPLHISQPSKLYTINYILILISVLISAYDAVWAEMPRYLLNMIIFAIYVKFEIQKKTSTLQKMILIVLSLGFTYNFSGFILFDEYKGEQIGIIFIFCPFLLNCLMKLQSKQNQINYTKNRKIDQVYNNLLLIEQNISNSFVNQLEILIMLRMKSDLGADPFKSELLLFNDKIIKSKNQTKAHWYLKYIAIKIVKSETTEALSLINHFQNQLLYCEVNKQFVKAYFQLSFIQSLQLEKIKLEVYEKLYYNTIRNYDILGRQVSNFINYKIKITKTQKEIQQLFEKKEIIYTSLIENKKNTNNQIFNQSNELIKEALAIQGDLKLQLFQNKTLRIQQLSIILCVEFFNNVFQAELIRNYSLLNEEVKQNYLENMEFLGMRINDQKEDIILFEMSQDFLKELGFQNVKTLNELQFRNFIPNDFYDIHQDLVKEFLETGKNKLLEKPQDVIIRGFNDIYYYTQFQLTIQPNDENGLQFYGFVQILEEQPKTLLINKSKVIVGVSTSFQKLLQELKINSSKLIFSDVRKLIKNYSQFQLNKYEYLQFIDVSQDFTVYLKEKMNLIELQIVEGVDILMQEQDCLMEEVQQDLQLDEESKVIIPKVQTFKDIYSPKSTFSKGDQIKFTLIRNDTKQFLTIQNQAEISKISEPVQQVIQQFNSKISPAEKQENLEVEQASSKFTRGILDHSIYYKKYSQLDQFVTTIKNKEMYLFIAYFIFGLLMNFIFQLVNLSYFLSQFELVTRDADSLSVKSYFTTPIHSCLVAQFATIYYLIYNKNGLLSDEDLFNQIQFSQDSVFKCSTFLKNSFTLELSNSNLQPFFTDIYISMYQSDGDNVQSRNISLRNALMFFHEAQYFTMQEDDNENGTIKVKMSTQLTNNFIYYMANILTIDDYFNELSQIVLEEVLNRGTELSDRYTVFFLRLAFLQLVFFLIAFSYLRLIFLGYENQIKLFSTMNISAAKYEIYQINRIKQLLSSDNAYQNYNFDVRKQEKQLQKANVIQQTIAGVSYKPPILQLLIYMSVLSLIFLVPITMLQFFSQTFLEKYSNSGKLLQQLSEMSSSIPAVYELKDTVYQINQNLPFYFYVDDAMAAQYLQKVLSELDKIHTFIQLFPKINYQISSDEMFISEQFEALEVKLNNNSLCDFLVHYSKELAQQHCDEAYGGALNLGLISSISEIYMKNYEEYVNTDGFQASKRTNLGPYEEFEVALIASDAFIYYQRALYNDIITSTNQLVSFHKIINFTFIVVSLVVAFIILNYFLPYFVQQQKIVRHMIFLVPKQQFYLDPKFETNFRLLLIKQK